MNAKYADAIVTDKRYTILLGGRSAGRSHFASQLALSKLVAPEYLRCAIMRFVLTDIRKSIYQEIRDRIEEQEVEDAINITDNFMRFDYQDNTIVGIGFRKSSSDQKSKLKSLASFNMVIIEEADEIVEEDFLQLDDSLRTTKSDIRIVLLLNPPHRTHWIIKRWFNLEPSPFPGYYVPTLKDSRERDTLFIHTTYRDNIKNLNESTIRNFEDYRTNNADHYYSMIEGLVSEGMRGRIFTKWKTIPTHEYEQLDYPVFYGMDMGFTNDPTALVEVKEHNNRVYVRELLYETGLTNTLIDQRLTALGVPKHATVYADSAEPKSIEELRVLGWNVQPSVKGQGSRKAGVNHMLSKEIHYTEDSTNVASEIQTYCWQLDRNKEPTNEPADGNDHAIDAIRYCLYSKTKTPFTGLY